MSETNRMEHPIYQRIKHLYANVKPLRGKRASENIRPAWDRRRDNERVIEVQRSDGTWYGYRLYNTDVVLVSSAGEIEFNTGGWNTRSTTDFMGRIGRSLGYLFRVYSSDNKVWVSDMFNRFPILNSPTTFMISGRALKPTAPIIEEIPEVDRVKMKQAMLPFMPMVGYITTLHKLTEGVVTEETIEENSEAMGWNRVFKFSTGGYLVAGYSYSPDYDVLLDIATNGTTEDWNKVYCWMVCKYGRREYSTEKYMDVVKPAVLRNRIAEVVKSHVNVWKYKQKDWAVTE